MSYEGYVRVLCSNGHLHEYNVYNFGVSDPDTCPLCKGLAVWKESVDQTNLEESRTDLIVFRPKEITTCKECGKKQVVEPTRYYIPSNTGHRLNEHVKVAVPFIECEVVDDPPF